MANVLAMHDDGCRAGTRAGTVWFMQNLLATMVTTTSHGMWLPGDLRGYVEDGVVLPPSPSLLRHAERLMTAEPVLFTAAQQIALFDALVEASQRYGYNLLCASVEAWHAHWLIDHRADPVEVMVGRLKTAMRKALNRGRIWTEGYDKRFCFTLEAIEARRAYIMRHAGYRPLPIAH
jgi:hypothetical protein